MAATKLLLKRGANLDCTKEDGITISAMDAASRFKHVQALLQRFQDEGIEGLENFDEEELGRAHRVGRVEELGEGEEPSVIEEQADKEELGKAEDASEVDELGKVEEPGKPNDSSTEGSEGVTEPKGAPLCTVMEE